MPNKTQEPSALIDPQLNPSWTPSVGNLPGFAHPPRHTSLPVWHGDPPPVICEVGPCANFHKMEVVLDSQQPIDGSPGDIYTDTVRTCYPHPGIEMDLKGVPVMACSRWKPTGRGSASSLRKGHERRLKLWQASQEKRRKDLEMAASNAAAETGFVDASDEEE